MDAAHVHHCAVEPLWRRAAHGVGAGAGGRERRDMGAGVGVGAGRADGSADGSAGAWAAEGDAARHERDGRARSKG